jgi:LPXTG-site transpeptidase (sortase) family protein
MKLVSKLFILAGIVFFTIGFYNIYLRENPKQLAFDQYQVSQSSVSDMGKLPVKISINAVGINTPVYPSKIVNNIPETTDKGASYLTESPIPGAQGNSIIYAHNWRNLFGPLTAIHTGEDVDVQYADGTKKTFVIEYTSVVNPSESTILLPSTDSRITLYTCTGFLDSKRFVAIAVLKS